MRGRHMYRVKWFKLMTIVLSIYFLYFCVGQQSRLNVISSETESIRSELVQIQQVNATLKEERDALNDDRYVEKLAREELGLVKPGETPYIVTKKK